MPLYRVRPGVRFGAYRQYGPGDVVELKISEAESFLDKLELMEEPKQVSSNVQIDASIRINPIPVSEPESASESGGDGEEEEEELPFADPPGQDNTVSLKDLSGTDFDVAGSSVREIMQAVEEGEIDPEYVWEAEKTGRNRKSLFAALEPYLGE